MAKMRSIICFFAILFALNLSAQFGIRVNYGMSHAPNWEELVSNSDFFQTTDFFGGGYTLGIDYWLRLKQTRIEFYPELRYSIYSSTARTALINSIDSKVNSTAWAFITNTHFYILDFFGDCDCPTFSKQGGAFKKGFFLSVNPGVYYHTKSSIDDSGNLESFSPIVGVGAGLDLGISDLITITPTVQYAIGFNDKLDGTAQLLNLPDLSNLESSSFQQWLFGIRIGLRPDYKN